jgi:GntR family transcriptional regulator
MSDPVKWREVESDLRDQIARGLVKPGAPVQSEAALARRYGFARGTVRLALVELERTGVLVPGRPRRVAQYRPVIVHVARTQDRTWAGESPTAGADSWVADMRAAGLEPSQIITVERTVASTLVAPWLGVGVGSPLIARRLVRLADRKTHNLIAFWFPEPIAQGTVLSDPASIIEGSVAWLESRQGPMQHELEVSARMPTPEEATQLRIPQGIPVLIVWRTATPPDYQPVMASMAVYPADRVRLRWEPS